MRTLKTIIFVLCFLLPMTGFSQGFVDENAGLRYLMAIGYMPEFTTDELANLDSLNTLEEYDALSVKIKAKLGKKRFGTVYRLMQNADECKHFSLLIDHEYSLNSFAPPYRVIRNFSNYLMAEAWDLFKRNEVKKAAELMILCLGLGHNISSEGMMINAMPGISIQTDFILAIENLLYHTSDIETRNIIKDHFNSAAKTSINLTHSLKAETRYSRNFTKDIQNKPEIIADRMFREENKAPGKTEKEIKCLDNKNILKFALDIATMDNKDMSELKPAEKILSFLVEKKYISGVPVCPRGGKYSIVFEENGFYDAHCTCGSSFLSGPSKELTAEQLDKAKQYLSSEQFQKDCQTIEEFCQEIEKIKGIDEESLALANDISDQLEKIESPLIKLAILRPAVFIEEARNLQKLYDKVRLSFQK